jgi:hypothetical protein
MLPPAPRRRPTLSTALKSSSRYYGDSTNLTGNQQAVPDGTAPDGKDNHLNRALLLGAQPKAMVQEPRQPFRITCRSDDARDHIGRIPPASAVLLHDKHAFGMHVLAARHRHRQEGP